MARISYTVYKHSVLATIISFLSRIAVIFGVFIAVAGITDREFAFIGVGIVIFLVFGIGGSALAESINAKKGNEKWWKESVEKPGWAAKIPNSIPVCFQVYNANPNPWTLNKIRTLNPAGADQIQQALPTKK